MPPDEHGNRVENCNQQESLEMAAAICSDATEYALLAHRFKLLNLVQRIAHADVMDMIEAVGLDALTSREALSYSSYGPFSSNAAVPTRNASTHSIYSKVHIGKLGDKEYRNNLVRVCNQSSRLSHSPRGETLFSTYLPRRTRDDERAMAAALNNKPSFTPRSRADVNAINRANIVNDSTLNISCQHRKSVIASRGSRRFRSNDEKDAFFVRMAVPKHHYSESLVKDVHACDQSNVSIEGKKEASTLGSVTSVERQLDQMPEPARRRRGKVAKIRARSSASSSTCPPHPIPTDKERGNSTIHCSSWEDYSRKHRRSAQVVGSQGHQDHEPVSQAAPSPMAHAPGPSLSSRPRANLTSLHQQTDMVFRTLSASHEMNTSVSECSSSGQQDSRKQIKPVLTLSSNNDTHSTRHIACNSPTPKAKPLSPYGVRHLPMEAICHAASILSEQLPSIAALQGSEVQQRQSEALSQSPSVTMKGGSEAKFEMGDPSAEEGIQVSLDNTDSLQQLSSTIDKMLQDHQRILQEVASSGLEVSTLEANQTRSQMSSQGFLSEGTRHRATPTIVTDTKTTEKEEYNILCNEMLAYTELQQRIDFMETELEKVEASVYNDIQENNHHSARIPEQAHNYNDFSKNSLLVTSPSLPSPIGTTLGEQHDVEENPTVLPSLDPFSIHEESRALHLKQRGERMPDSVVRRLLAHQHKAHEYISYSERQYNTSQVSQYLFTQRLTNTLLEDCFSEVVKEVERVMDDYILGLVEHELH
ncbi:unnamed protein product [Phytomonas sp. EM1]|nr:unnamed protein product [Phytomonas sp. EM1]|eukprot:CCW60805.1 unnamed protein product [Phytomonas sp. isolate EM1]